MSNKTNKIEINVKELFKIIKNDKKQIVLYSIVAAVIAIIVAFSIPRIYKTKVMLAPETSNGSGLSGSISSIAEMVGMNIGVGSDDAIYPEIYPDLITSKEFLVTLFSIKVKSKDGKINSTYYDYMLKYQKSPWWLYPLELLNNFLKKIKGPENIPVSEDGMINPFWLSKEQSDIAQAISNSIDCSVDKKTSVITLEITAQDALISATLADSIKGKLQLFITKYRTNKSRHDLAYMQSLYEEAKDNYLKDQEIYARYAEAYQNLSLTSYKVKLEELENEMQLKYNIYTQISQQLQLSKAKVQERTPAFSVVQSASVPLKHSNKPKIVILAIFLIIGIGARLSVLLYKNKESIFSYNAV